LYKDGLQRERFMPAIEMLEKHCKVLNVDGGTDYRLRTLEQAEIYHYPNDDAAKALFEATFNELAPTAGKRGLALDINHRQMQSIRVADDVVWFSFDELCDGPRSQADYIELARQFHTVMLSGVPQLTWETENQARRFINLIDEFYDRSVILIISADTPLTEIYTGKRVKFEFDRTVSRLLEMQSHEYLGRAHKP
jgi:cell division protein ZapE